MQQQTLQMNAGVALKSPAVLVILSLWSQLLDPRLQIFEQAGLVIAHDNRRVRMRHGHKNDPVAKRALFQRKFHLRRNIYELALLRGLKRQNVRVDFHSRPSGWRKHSSGTVRGVEIALNAPALGPSALLS